MIRGTELNGLKSAHWIMVGKIIKLMISASREAVGAARQLNQVLLFFSDEGAYRQRQRQRRKDEKRFIRIAWLQGQIKRVL